MSRPKHPAIAALLVAMGSAAPTAAANSTPAGSTPVAGPVPVVTGAAPELPATAADAGDVVVTAGTDPGRLLVEGDSTTVFSLRLPDGAECPGDSANDDWRVQTFIVPADADPATLAYGATRPRGEGRFGLYTTEGRPYTQVLLAQNPSPGIPGQILAVPPLSFAPFTPDLLPEGRYRIGVACSYYEVGERFWDAEIEITADPDVQPGERRWSVVGSASARGDTAGDAGDRSSSRTAVLVIAAGVGLVAAAAWLMRLVSKPQRRIP